MKKKRRASQPERSAFESARAALERAGEEEPPVSLDDSQTPEPAKPIDSVEQAELHTSVSEETPEAVTNEEVEALENPDGAEPEAPANPDSMEPEPPINPDSVEAQAPENSDSVDAQPPVDPDSVEGEAPANSDSVEVETPLDPEGVEAEPPADLESVEAEPPENPDSVDAQTPVDPKSAEAETLENPESVFSQLDTDAASDTTEAPESDVNTAPLDADGMPMEEAEASEGENPESPWDAEYEPFSDEEEVTDAEKHTMETKEITLGYHKSPEADEPETPKESAKESEKRDKKPRFQFLKRVREAVRGYGERMRNDDAPPSVTSRDAALRKRVMQIEDEETRNYLLDRVLPQMTWYSRKSAQYQAIYYRLMAATIILGALIPILSPWANHTPAKILLVILGASVTAINAYLALHNYHDLAIAYRMTREDLTHTLYCYFNRASVFSQKKMLPENLDVLLVDICEETLSKEIGGWRSVVTGSPV